MKRIYTALVLLSVLVAKGAYGETKVDPTLRVAAEQRYDDDLLLRTDTDGPLTGQFATKVSPQLGARLRAPTWTMHTWYALDAMYRQTTGSTRIDHRGALKAKRQFSARTSADLELNVYRVTDPTSLPRMGVARTMSPVFYARGLAGAGLMATERVLVRPHLLAEGAQILETGRDPGYSLAPAIETWFLQTRRLSYGAEYRFQYFAMGQEAARANGVFGLFRYRISRPVTFTARVGPVFYAENGGGAQGMIPRVLLELGREYDGFDLGFVVGNDLVGASGFNNALWAQFAGVTLGLRVSEPLRVYGHGSYYRNGPAPGDGISQLLPTSNGSTGYGGEVGLEYRVNRFVSLQGAFTRIAQVGTEGADLSRNIAAVRLILTNVE